MNKLNLFLMSFLGFLAVMLVSCSDDNVTIDSEDKLEQVMKDNPYYLMVDDVNLTWGEARDLVISNQSSDYTLEQEGESFLVYSKNVNGEDVAYLSYKFDKNDNLSAATITFHDNDQAVKASDGIYTKFDGEEYSEDGMEIKKSNDGNILTVDKSSTLSGDIMITIGYTYYVPCEMREDCVDLGLSVQWATANLGATTPTDVGDFYSWSETKTKSQFWIDNYAFSNNYTSKYVYEYKNPLTNICGAKYDIAKERLGDGWEMPSLAAANELIEKCTWEKAEVDGVSAYIVTGPNGNSIILPIIAYNYQNKGYTYRSGLYLATGECVSKSSDDCYVITAKRNGNQYIGAIDTQWKCWGYNVRPIYTK